MKNIPKHPRETLTYEDRIKNEVQSICDAYGLVNDTKGLRSHIKVDMIEVISTLGRKVLNAVNLEGDEDEVIEYDNSVNGAVFRLADLRSKDTILDAGGEKWSAYTYYDIEHFIENKPLELKDSFGRTKVILKNSFTPGTAFSEAVFSLVFYYQVQESCDISDSFVTVPSRDPSPTSQRPLQSDETNRQMS